MVEDLKDYTSVTSRSNKIIKKYFQRQDEKNPAFFVDFQALMNNVEKKCFFSRKNLVVVNKAVILQREIDG